jgi:predicted nuclease of predicted toxin-antitoxin system
VRFIVDAQLPPALAHALTAAGFAAAHVADIGLLTASDMAIWDRATKERAAIITKDGDFAYLHRPGSAQAAVVWLRVGNTAREPLIQWLLPLVPEIVAALEAGESLVEIRR